jgi:hypothetical protein
VLLSFDFSDNGPLDAKNLKLLAPALSHPDCALETLALTDCAVDGRGFGALAPALGSNGSLEYLMLSGLYTLSPSFSLSLSLSLSLPLCPSLSSLFCFLD